MEYDISYFNNLIFGCNNYYAHLPKDGDCGKPEMLSEHSSLVIHYAHLIAEKHNLNCILLKLIDSSIPSPLKKHNKSIAVRIEILFWRAIAFHDLGKVNKKYQVCRMNNHAYILDVKHKFESHHSVISMYMFLAYFWRELYDMNISDEEKIFLCNIALYLSYPIYNHHNSYIGKAQNDIIWIDENLKDLKPYLSLFREEFSDEYIEQFHNCYLAKAKSGIDYIYDWFECISEPSIEFPLFSLVKLLYSLLTASDYLATAHYMNNWDDDLSDFGLISDVLRQKIINSAENYKYNKPVYEAIRNNNIPDIGLLQNTSNHNLNELRENIAIEVVKNVRRNSKQDLFYIEAPTGGGKTNVSMLAMAELLQVDKTINKVFYVLPFTTLITQTYKSLSETLGLCEGELAEIHSKAPIQNKKKNVNNLESIEYLNYLDNLFANYPITVLSHVHFFDILKSNDKETNYLLYRMANSVVIIDEIQSYSPSSWDKIVYLITNYAKYFNMKFIVMSATLPKIGDIVDSNLAKDFVYLIKNKNLYFQNSNFCNRVHFDYSLLDWEAPEKEKKHGYLLRLKNFIFEKSLQYSENNLKNKNSVYTIIEFIFKKTASEFYEIVMNNNVFDEVFLLSGTILEPRRKYILNKLKSSECRNKRILLISTQVVEAGVDIDMDLGFKDRSIVDSEEQLAGRINRNVNKPECTLYLFNCDSATTIYGKDERYRIMNDFNINEYKHILKNKDFDSLYKLIIEKIKERNLSSVIINIHDELELPISILDYSAVNNSLKLIDSPNVSVFIPMKIETKYLGKELLILDEFNIPHEQSVNGADVWQIYESTINSPNKDFVKDRIKMKKLQAIISNFTFSIFPNSKDFESIKTFGYEKYNFLYLENYREIYSFEDGINTTILNNSNFI